MWNNALLIVLASAAFLVLAYLTYGRLLARRVLDLRNDRPTPAVTQEDGVDYVPTRKAILFGHHFASIAGLAPIVGPAIAILWGWVPALLWLLLGAVFIGAVHDMSTLVASIRHKAANIGDVTREVIGPRAQVLFLVVIFFLLALAMGVFALLMAGLFTDDTPQAIIPTFSLILVAVVIGLLVYRMKWPLGWITLGGLVVMFAMLFVGVKVPVPIYRTFVSDSYARREIEAHRSELVSGKAVTKHFDEKLSQAEAAAEAPPPRAEPRPAEVKTVAAAKADVSRAIIKTKDTWVYSLLVYAFIASVLPVWLLLQPRDYINSFLLYAGLLSLVVGFIVWHPTIQAAAFNTEATIKGQPWWPFLFITIACGAVSGFHNIVSTGTTARQLKREGDAHPVAYGGMLTETFLGVLVVAACASALPAQYDYAKIFSQANLGGREIHLGGFLKAAGRVIAAPIAAASGAESAKGVEAFCAVFISVVVVSFAMTSLDTGTRLLRYNVESITKLLGRGPRKVLGNRYVASLLAVVAIGFIALLKLPDASGKMRPAGLALWQLFGTTNQILAALGLLIISVYLWVLRKPIVFTLVPMVGMLVMVAWAMVLKIAEFHGNYSRYGDSNNLTLLIMSCAILVVAAWVCVEAVIAFSRKRPPAEPKA